MNKQFCDKCGCKSNDDHVDYIYSDNKKYKVSLIFQQAQPWEMHLWGSVDLCGKCKREILKEIARTIVEERWD